MTVSNLIANQPENLKASKDAMTHLIEFARSNFFGSKDPYTFEGSIKEFADEFLRTKVGFAHYEIKGRSVFFVNEKHISPEQELLLSKVRLVRTGSPGIYALGVGKVAGIPTVREPIFESVRRDHDEN